MNEDVLDQNDRHVMVIFIAYGLKSVVRYDILYQKVKII